MEKLVKIIDQFCTFSLIEKRKLFKRVIFNFIIGNEDMHLKNYSVIVNQNKVELSPAYDFLNSSIVLKGDIEEIALTLYGKKKNLTRQVLINYFGKERCGLTEGIVLKILSNIKIAIPEWLNLIEISFLSGEMKEKYTALLKRRIQILGLN